MSRMNELDLQRKLVLSSIRNAPVDVLAKIANVSRAGEYNKKAAIKEIQSSLSSDDVETVSKIVSVASKLLR